MFNCEADTLAVFVMVAHGLNAALHWSALLFTALLLSASVVSGADLKRLAPSNAEWQLRNTNGSISIPIRVPGYATEALEAFGYVGDPLFRNNEELQMWVNEESAWTFSTNIPLQATDPVLQHKAIDLLFDGLDTIADVALNGAVILQARNFHRRYRVPVKQLLKPGTNTLSIKIQTPSKAVQAAAAAYPYPVPANPPHGNPLPEKYRFYNFIRKPASDYGWDWGPAIVPVGIHGNVTLIGYSSPILSGVHVLRQTHGLNDITLDLEAEIWSPDNGPHNLTLTSQLPGVTSVTKPADVWTVGIHYIKIQMSVPVDAVKLWWPVGLGAQPLYTLHTTLQDNSVAGSCQDTGANWQQVRGFQVAPNSGCSIVNLRLGFRQIEVVTEPLNIAAQDLLSRNFNTTQGGPSSKESLYTGGPVNGPTGLTPSETASSVSGTQYGSNASTTTETQGESFYFRINGVPVYMRGANLIPLHVLHNHGTPKAVRALLKQAVRANMNMIRVWGGGRYQIDEFYTECDSLGILVWQELMYACAPYPQEPGLMQQGVDEAEEVVRRLAYHPCIAIWGGNNEVEALFTEYKVVRQNLALYASDFNAWFVNNLRQVIRRLDPGRTYLDTSPTNGLFSRAPYIKRWGDTTDARFGDVHYYNYNQDCMDTRHLPAAKFVSEVGWQSAPSWQAVSRETLPKDWYPWSAGMQYRQRHPQGDAQMLRQIRKVFKVPPSWPDRPEPITPAAAPTIQPQSDLLGAGQQPMGAAATSSAALTLPAAKAAWPESAGPDQMVLPGALRIVPATQWPSWRNVDAQTLLSTQEYPSPQGLNTSLTTKQPTRASAGGSGANAQGGVSRALLPDQEPRIRLSYNESWANKTVGSGPPPDFKAWIYLTQAQHALCMSTMVDHWRSLSQDPTALNMGVLYWQLNDIWPGYSWSGLDYPASEGSSPHWKPLHYAMARSFAPLIVVPTIQGSTLQVNLSSSIAVPLAATVTVRLLPIRFPAKTLACNNYMLASQNITLSPLTSQLAWDASLSDVFAKLPGCSRRTCYLSVDVEWWVDTDKLEASGYSYSAGATNTSNFTEFELTDGAAVWSSYDNTTANCTQPGWEDQQQTTGNASAPWWKLHLIRMAGVTYPTVLPSNTLDGQQPHLLTDKQIWFTRFKDMEFAYLNPKPHLKDWLQETCNRVCFTAEAPEGVLPLVVFETEFEGFFSDNLFTLDPCKPKRICFTHDGDESAQFNVITFQAGLSSMSVADYMTT